MRRTISLLYIFSLILVFGAAPAAWADYNPFNIQDLHDNSGGSHGDFSNDFIPADIVVSPFSGELSGQYNLIFLGYEAGNYNSLNDGSGNEIFYNGPGSADNINGLWVGPYDIQTLTLNDNSDGDPTGHQAYDFDHSHGGVSNHLQAWVLDQPNWLVTDTHDYGVNFPAITLLQNDIIIGFGDSAGDGDFDDMIYAARAVPIPGAVWLLGSGLLGLVGLRRFKRT